MFAFVLVPLLILFGVVLAIGIPLVPVVVVAAIVGGVVHTVRRHHSGPVVHSY